MLDGDLHRPILVIVSAQGVQARCEGVPLAGEQYELLLNSFNKADISSDQFSICLIADTEIIRSSSANVLVPLGDKALYELTALVSQEKYHCSILQSTAEYGNRKVLPVLHPERVLKQYRDSMYLTFGAMKIKVELEFPELRIPERELLINPTLSQIEAFCYELLTARAIGVDIETGCGQINTVGFAITPTRAIAIRVSNDNYWSPEELYRVWQLIHMVLKSATPKVCQNYIYETVFLSAYGMTMNNVVWDTMWAMKFLFPEAEKGLHNVGRIYTPFPYWKDDNDDWNNIRDWNAHLDYNCKDTTGTLWAYYEQRVDMEHRGLLPTFEELCLSNMPIISEMCISGLLVDEKEWLRQKDKATLAIDGHQEFVDRFFQERLDRKVNTKSPVQMKKAFKELGIAIPVQKGKESLDKKALTKLRKKHPQIAVIPQLIALSKENKKNSSYLDITFDMNDKKLRYSLDGHGTETGRWGGYKDPWGNGFNPQTVPKYMRRIFQAKLGHVLVEIDLSQAESRYVAYDGPDAKLINLLESGADVHKYVAARIFNKPEELIGKESKERQLGKKAGHASNYGTGPRTFAEMCLVEMDMVLDEREAKRIIQTYYGVFPGIVHRQQRIQQELRNTKRLRTPLGRERIFYDRLGDATFREGYAYCPQSTIPDITNALMRFLWRTFPDATFLLQVHDSLLLEVQEGRQYEIADAARDYQAWHPKITLPGGSLIIPVDCEWGTHWKPMEKM